MADLKISQLTGATTPLAGTEVVPLVQSGATKKVAVSDLTAGRAVSGTSFAATNGGYTATVASGNVGYGATSGTTNYSFYIDATDGSYRLYSSFGGDRWSVDSSGNITVGQSNLVIGTSGKGISLPGGITWTSGAGSPEGVVTAPVGSLYSRSDGGVLTSLYVKQSGTGNTGWAGK
jgi:hypothetical protein